MVVGKSPAAPRVALSGKPFPVRLTEVAAASGLNARFTYGKESEKKYVIEANGSGVALVDYDNDGLLDVYLVNGSRLEGFGGAPAPTNWLYRNLGNGRFADVTAKAGVAHSGWGNGVCAGDFDNDGFTDLYVTYWGPNVLYRNKGGATFEEVAVGAGVAGPRDEWSTGCTFLDYDRDGRLDLLVTSYVDFRLKTAPLPGQFPFCLWKGAPVYCGPRGLPYGTTTLYHNRGDGTFEDVSEKAGIREVKNYYGFTTVAADLNGDGWTDIYIACDSTPSIFFRNNHNGTFTDIATEAGVAYNEHGAEEAGMGASVADYDNDGVLDIVKTNFVGDYPNLYRGLGKGVFEDNAYKAGLAVNPHYVLWGTGFADLDNDGWKDVVQVSGHVYPEVERIDRNDRYKGPRVIYRNLGNGKFEDVSSSAGPDAQRPLSSRGAAFGDFDNDGDIDVLIMNMHEPVSLLRNDLKSSNHWLQLKLQGTKSNRGAIGAVVTVAGQTAAVLSQSSFLSQSDFRLHFGLGAADRVEKITVRWPSGAVEDFPGAQAGATWLLVEGSGKVERK